MSELSPLPALDGARTDAALRDWLPSRRWYQGKARTIGEARLLSAVDLGPVELGRELIDLIIEIDYSDESREHYQVPVVVDGGAAGHPDAFVLRAADGTDVICVDALGRHEAVRRYATLIAQGVEIDAGSLGILRGRPVAGVGGELPGSSRVAAGEQSNTSVILGDSLILKVLRRLDSGIHPDIELTRGLTEAGFTHIPPQIGSLELTSGGWPTALAVLSRFVPGADDGWELAVAATTALARGETPRRPVTDRLSELGEAVGEMHRVLAQTFDAHAAGPAELSTWSHSMREQLERVLGQARDRAAEAVAPLEEAEATLWRVIDEVQSLPLSEVGPMTRIHGDLHLGQTLVHPEWGWQILDFEGEPSKSIEERRQPSSPLRDVAGMLRSFDYAAAAGTSAADLPVTELPEAVIAWRDDARGAFLDGYGKSAPEGLPQLGTGATLLAVFELDKAVYELGYELANRPPWVPIPVSGILRAVERYTARD